MSRLILLLSLAASACAPVVQLEVMRAADVTIPTHVQTVAVVDRSGAKNVGQGILGALEGAVSGEAIGADTEGRREAMRGLVETLRSGPRFQVVQPVGIEAERSLFDRELSWTGAREICARAGCDAIVALEAFDSDSALDHRTRDVQQTLSDGTKVTRTEHSAERRTRVLAAWRVYDPDNAAILDDVRDRVDTRTWTETGDTREAAAARLPAQGQTVALVGYDAGASYARRIAPTPVLVTRTLYARGDDTLKQARPYVRARDWAGAARLWEGLAEHPDPKIRGRARYNLAIAAEVEGRLDRAAELARDAAVLLRNGRARAYVATIDQRVRDRDRVQEQLAPPR